MYLALNFLATRKWNTLASTSLDRATFEICILSHDRRAAFHAVTGDVVQKSALHSAARSDSVHKIGAGPASSPSVVKQAHSKV